ncbi:DUF3237 domain-containing protein [Niabella ginsengisoli]|uniref:UPF0311 protein MKP09_09325 n=1 Tax=Niabella ginsengisoli TaxID=522298 RepID=A0ABS9SIB6_9BACT|nr:DUF3237 domain-containing protein [Niabella ginsengisoli]MCH5598095.1 DUF3237 domain-containing protein [Niabella ginsengisoli]
MKKRINASLIVIAIALLMTNTANAQKLASEFLYKITLSIDTPFDIGKIPIGRRTIYPIKGGSFEGPKLKGKVRAFGADWILRLDSLTSKLDVRLLLETDDGQLISNSYSGIIYKKPDGTSYWRITPIFETSSKKYEWLNYLLGVGVGSFSDGGVTYNVFEIK